MRHPGSAFSSICFSCQVKEDVFHCKKCEEDCHEDKIHIKISELNQAELI